MELSVETVHARQLGIVHPDVLNNWPVTVIGLGAIGSTTARVLSQLGFRQFRFYDNDVVEVSNLGTQFYDPQDIDFPKVEACRDRLQQFLPDVQVDAHRCNYTGQSLAGIVVAGVDSMAARSTIWRSVRESVEIPLFIDGRTAGEELHIYTIRPADPDDIKLYDKSLVPDSETAQLPCSEQGAPHVQAVIAGLIANQIVRWVRKEGPVPYAMFNLRMLHLAVSR